MKTIDDTGIKNEHSNGARTQVLLLENEQKLFKIAIKSESHDFQSYARLYLMADDKKWTLIKSEQPKRDYGIDISYQDRYSQKAFSKIIDSLKELAKKI